MHSVCIFIQRAKESPEIPDPEAKGNGVNTSKKWKRISCVAQPTEVQPPVQLCSVTQVTLLASLLYR